MRILIVYALRGIPRYLFVVEVLTIKLLIKPTNGAPAPKVLSMGVLQQAVYQRCKAAEQNQLSGDDLGDQRTKSIEPDGREL